MTGDTSLDLFVLRKDVDFGFAFGDTNFSDRILNIEIVDEANGHTPSGDADSNEEQIMNQPDNIRDDMDTENQAEETAAMIEEPISGDEGARANDIDSNRSMECSTIPRVKTLHISSLILAAKSPFFYKLFSNEKRESEQRHATLRIKASEEGALMELLNFMYSNTLKVTTAPALLDVLMIADKFEVTSCMRYCICSLRNVPMTPECALLYLDLPSSAPTAEGVQPLIDAAKQFLVVHDKDITKFYDAALNLPLAEVEAILASDDLQVASEDAVYDFVLKWSRIHYPKIEERREIVATRLAQFIRYPYMSCRELRKVVACKDFEHEFAQKVVVEALFFKAQAPHKQHTLVAQENLNPNRRFVERAYKYRPVKVVEFELPSQCEVYLDLKREQCAKLFPSGRVFSEAFHLGGQGFFLSAHCNMNKQSSFHCFGMYLGMQENGSVTLVDYEFAARSKPTEEYINKYNGNHTFTAGVAVGYRNLFATSWTSFMAEDSPYFINGVLHLRARLTIRH